MTPKEKALELYNKMYETGFKPKSVLIRIEQAKECALIAVDEIREALIYGKLDDSPYTSLEARQFYLQVKQEIENL